MTHIGIATQDHAIFQKLVNAPDYSHKLIASYDTQDATYPSGKSTVSKPDNSNPIYCFW
jgi:hypothetical protein